VKSCISGGTGGGDIDIRSWFHVETIKKPTKNIILDLLLTFLSILCSSLQNVLIVTIFTFIVRRPVLICKWYHTNCDCNDDDDDMK